MCEVCIGCTAVLLRVKKQTNIKKVGTKKMELLLALEQKINTSSM